MLKRLMVALASAAVFVPLALSAPAQTGPAQAAPAEKVSCGAPGTPPSSCVENGPPEFNPGAKSMTGLKSPKIVAKKGHQALRPERAASRMAPCPAGCFFYGGNAQVLGGTDSALGMAANLHVYKPYLDPVNGGHTLAEIAVERTVGGQRQIVEVGTTVDPGVCGAQPVPCMFSFWWKNGVGQGYNVNFTPYAPTCSVAANYCIGESLLGLAGAVPGNGNPYRFQIQHNNGAWWLAFNNMWVGDFNDSLWTGATPSGPGVTFTSGQTFQAFYEVVDFTTLPCSDMGNGLVASNGSAARVGTMALLNSSPAGIASNFSSVTVNSPYTQLNLTSPNITTARAGGPGFDSLGALPGVKDNC